MFALAVYLLMVRAFEFFRRGEKNRSCASRRTQMGRTTELAL
jgi:hypothetical protein